MISFLPFSKKEPSFFVQRNWNWIKKVENHIENEYKNEIFTIFPTVRLKDYKKKLIEDRRGTF